MNSWRSDRFKTAGGETGYEQQEEDRFMNSRRRDRFKTAGGDTGS
jgi:hypothetical protein